MRVGFLGLGGMGRAMAANILAAGHELVAWNRSPGPVQALVERGAVAALTPVAAFETDVVVSMLADDAATRAVVLESGALASARPGTVHLSMATLSVALAEELAQRHARAGVGYVAAPVFGRTEVAAAGKLNIVVAGQDADIARVQPLLDVMGQKTWPVGTEPARANVVKIAGNFMLISAIEAMGEAAALAEAHGVSAADLLEVLTGTLFAAPVYKGYGALIVERRIEPAAFPLTLGLKDVCLALSAGQARQVPLPLASILRDALLEALAHGAGHQDLAALAVRAIQRAGLD